MDGLPKDDNREQDRFAKWRQTKHLEGEEVGVLALMTRLAVSDIENAEPRDAAEMTDMMKALNIDPVEAEFEYRRLYYYMQANCAACHVKKRCRDDLACKVAAKRFVEYCENHELLNEMRADPDLLLDPK